MLQNKQAEASVLAPLVTSPAACHQGQQVVEGQRLIQTVNDPLPGWTSVPAMGICTGAISVS